MESPEGFDFSDIVFDHAQNPRNNRPLPTFNGHARITGPCGDTMEFWLLVQEKRVVHVSFITDGCGSSHACGSMATCLAEGKSVEEAAAISQQDILAALGGLPPAAEHCALLAANTLKAACEDCLRHLEAIGQESTLPAGSSRDDEPFSADTAQHPYPGESKEDFEDRRRLQDRLSRIRCKILVLSGKGGVGKSTLAVNLAAHLTLAGKQVGLLDVDIHGPSLPTMLGLEGEAIRGDQGSLVPVVRDGLKVMSIGFFLNNPDDAIIWRGPMKMSAIKQLLKDVAWGDLDFLIIDSPPGTGDEPLSVCQLLGKVDGALIVTTPQRVAAVDVRKSISFCRKLGVPVLGVVENMSGFVCPHCGETTSILRSGGGRRIAEDMQTPFLGSIPIDPQMADAGDAGNVFIQHYAASPTAAILREILKPIEALDAQDTKQTVNPKTVEDKTMKIAIPLADGKLAAHFGHCERFALLEVDLAAHKILKREEVETPPHQPGLLPP
jgi:Mrp family chromosome partitioning ATPase